MSRKELVALLVYYVILYTVVWVFWSDVPVRVRWHYHLHRTAQRVARTAGRIGLQAERTYYEEMGSYRG